MRAAMHKFHPVDLSALTRHRQAVTGNLLCGQRREELS
jgi:hypothetical protein